jgi:hypothetical protein
MTRIIHALPVDAAGDHRPYPHCPCHPVLAADMAEPGIVVYCHRHNAPRDAMPSPNADRLLWRSGNPIPPEPVR